MMHSGFDPKRGEWLTRWPGRVARHDLVFLTPPDDPVQGLPIGNGEIGVLGWFEPSRLVFALNKSDLWDDAAFGRFNNWRAEEEEFSTTLRHGCRIILDFGLPVFDSFYLKDFQARLNLAEAAIEVSAAGPFGSVTFTGFVEHASGVFRGEVDSRLTENVPLVIKVERFGSRTYSHWYAQINRNPELGLAGTQAQADGNGAYVTHKLTSGTFAAGVRVVETGVSKARYSVENSHTAGVTVTGPVGKQLAFLATVTSPLADDPIPALKMELETACQVGRTAMLRRHRKAWKSFWLRSFMECGDDYLDNLWHLTMFYAACSQRGKYPGRFVNGLWGWNRDVQNWNFYFHWNQQQVYWPLNAAGHHDLIESYLNFRFNSLPQAKADAHEAFGVDGAVFSDVCERRGYNSASEFHNHTPVAQIAMDFWRQYRFTGDREFLKSKALPFLREAAVFFESRFTKGDDGCYHAQEGTGYEGWISMTDTVSELTYGRVLFSAALDALAEAGESDARSGRWRDIRDHLLPLPTIHADKEFIRGGKYQRGWFKGEAALSNRLLTAGYGVKEKRWLTSFLAETPAGPSAEAQFEMMGMNEGKPALPDPYRGDIRCNDGIFPWVENAAVFPYGLVGLGQRGTALYKAAVDTARLYACSGMGWYPLGITLARLGLGREAQRVIRDWPIYWQFYANGWGHYGPLAAMKAESTLPGRVSHNPVTDTSLPAEERARQAFPFRMYPFRHMGMEAMSVLAGAMNESLLQSHDGVIRVGPAVDEGQTARFTLHAEGGFVVSAEIENGQPRWIAIESRRGGTCRVANPWSGAVLHEGDRKIVRQTARIVEFSAKAGGRYLLVPHTGFLRTWKTTSVRHARNEQAKIHPSGYATLGLPRMF
jgi:alpha-L-fucosidase 2